MSSNRYDRRTRITIDGHPELSVLVVGEGTPLLMLHGFTGDIRAWGDVPFRLARNHRIVVPDLPGHGDSEAPHDPGAYAPERLTDLLVRLMAEVAPGPAIWAGYSMGGRLALHAALNGAPDVCGLVLESASPGLESSDERATRVESDEVWARQLEDEGIESFVRSWIRQPLFDSQHRLPELVFDAERKRRLNADPLALAACLRGFGTGQQPSGWSELGSCALPALLLTGALDPKFDGIADAMAEQWPGARRVRVPGAGHAVHLEKPEAWLAMVSPFLDELSPDLPDADVGETDDPEADDDAAAAPDGDELQAGDLEAEGARSVGKEFGAPAALNPDA